MKHTLTSVAAVALALGTAAPAIAATAYMDGVLNVGPGWSTITMPDGSKCAAGCTEVKYDYITQGSATRAAGAWMDANNTPDSVLYTYSLGSTGAISARLARPDWQGQIIALGSPAKPNNGASQTDGGRPVVPGPNGGDVTFVSVRGDSVAFRTGSLNTHLNGYKNRDFSKETPVKVTEPSPVVEDIEYGTKPPTTAPAKLTWAQRAEIRKAERAERAEARKVAREERRAEARANWDRFVSKLKGGDAAEESDQVKADTEDSASE